MRRIAREDGTTLVELIVVMTLLGMILAVAFAVAQVARKGNDVSQRQAYAATEVGQPLDYFQKIAEQNTTLESPGAYTVTFQTDQNSDNVVERHVIQASADGRLTQQVYSTDNVGNNVALLKSFVWSTHNVNQARGLPMLTYKDASGTVIPNMANVPLQARTIVFTVVASRDDRLYQDSRTAFFRNR